MPHGYLRYDSPENYLGDRPQGEAAQLLERIVAEHPDPIAPRRVPPITDWFRVTDALRSGHRISVDAERLGRRVSIQFHDAPPFGGSYRFTGNRHGEVHAGKVSGVEAIEGNRLFQQRHAMMHSYHIRYVVTTTAEDRAGTQLYWRIAISDIREVTVENA